MQSLFINLSNHLDPVNNERLYGYSHGRALAKHYKVVQAINAGNIRLVLRMPENGARVTDSFVRGLLGEVISSGIFRVRFDELVTVLGNEDQVARFKHCVDQEFNMQSPFNKLAAWIQIKVMTFSGWLLKLGDKK